MFPSPDLNRTARHLKGIEVGLLLEAKKPLERTPHFFKPESVNVLTLPACWRPLLDSNQHIPDSLTRFKISSESLNGISG